MRKPVTTVFVLALLLWSSGETSAGQHSSCETPETVSYGDPATVECHFHRPHEKFMVYRILASNTKEHSIVAVCTHTESGPDCKNPEGHEITVAPEKDKATVHIASARQENSGTYFCKTLPAREDHASNCTLVVQSNTRRKGKPVTCEANTPVSLGQKTWLTCKFSKIAGTTGIALTKHSSGGAEISEEIVTCDRDGKCKVKKAGYTIGEKTETHVKISIPQLTIDHAGFYKCKSATLKGISDQCQLEAVQGQAEGYSGESPWTYAAYGALVVVLTFGLFGIVLFFVYRRCFGKPIPSDYNTVKTSPD